MCGASSRRLGKTWSGARGSSPPGRDQAQRHAQQLLGHPASGV